VSIWVQELERFEVKEALACLLHTIIFNRALGPLKAYEVDSEILDLSYARCDDAIIESLVDTRLEQLVSSLTKGSVQKDQYEHKEQNEQTCVLSFYGVTYKKYMKVFVREEKVYWEQWLIPVSIVEQKSKSSSERDRRAQGRQQMIRDRLTSIMSMLNEKDHIPPFKSSDKSSDSSTKLLPATLEQICFPFDITFSAQIPDHTEEASSWANSFKRIIKQGPPMLLKTS